VHEATRRLGGVLCINEFCGTWDLLEEFSGVLNWATTLGCMHACMRFKSRMLSAVLGKEEVISHLDFIGSAPSGYRLET